MLNIVAVILARGGSKRIPNKNIKKLGNKPLIAWTIETAIFSEAFSRVIVSTDCVDVAKVALEYGAEVPWLRPLELATDNSPSIDAVLHATNWVSEQSMSVDGVMLLQPTSPFRTKKNILSAIELFEKNDCEPVVSFREARMFPEWCFRIENRKLLPLLGWDAVRKRSQDIDPTLELNGLIYLASPHYLNRNLSFLGPTTIPLICDEPKESIDIDTDEDWDIAEQFLIKG